MRISCSIDRIQSSNLRVLNYDSACHGWQAKCCKRLHLLLVMAGIMMVTAAHAQRDNFSIGNGFYSFCSSASEEWQHSACLAYTKGLHDMAGFLWARGRVKPEICLPQGVSLSQYLDILLKYLKDNPDQRHKPTAELLWVAASKSYPCSR